MVGQTIIFFLHQNQRFTPSFFSVIQKHEKAIKTFKITEARTDRQMDGLTKKGVIESRSM